MKYFAFGDTHGYYDELMTSLQEAGYQIFNPDHCLIGLGDYFDRGSQSKEILEFLNTVPRKVLLLGNHELYLMNMMQRGYIGQGDVHNGVLATIESFTGLDEFHIFTAPDIALNALSQSDLKSFINDLSPYFKTKDYFFTHAWLPNWIPFEDASSTAWAAAVQTNTSEAIKSGDSNGLKELELTGRKLVAGHRYTMWLRKEIRDDGNPDPHAIWYHKNFIAIDGCTALSHKVNILVFEDEPLNTLLAKQD